MSYEDEFDKIIRDKVGEAQYPFEESNWAKTSRLIDADRTAARKVFIKKLFLPAVLVIGSAVLFTVSQIDTGKTLVAEQKQEIVAPAEKNSAGAALALDSDINEVQPEIQSSRSTEKTASNDPIIKTSQKSNQSNPEQEQLIEKTNSGSSNSEIKKTNNLTPASAVYKTEGPVASAPKTNSKSDDKKATITNEQNLPDETSVDEGLGGVTPVGAGLAGGVTVANNNSGKNNESPVQSQTSEENSAAVVTLEAEILNTHQSLLPYSAASENASLPIVFLPRYEPDYYSKKAKTHFVNVEFGGTYLTGWNTSTGKDGQGLNWFGGVNYGYYVGKFSLGLGAQLYNITNIRESFYSAERVDYGFGSTRSFTTVTTNDMYYAAVPLRISYHLNRSNHIGLGFNAGYLVKMNNRLEGYDQTNDLPSTVRPSEKNSTLYEGVNAWNYMGSVFYNARINNRLAVHGEFVYSFTDLFQNNKSVTNSEKPMGVRLSLQYYLFDK